MNTLSRVEQPKSCDHVGGQTYGRIVKAISWASGWVDVGQCKEAELQCCGSWKAVGCGTLSGRQLPSAFKAVFVDFRPQLIGAGNWDFILHKCIKGLAEWES